MELMQLRYFCEVAESQHVTRSAEKLHIAQPALSMAIKRLEEELGVKLFETKGRGIRLTEYGRYLQERLRPVMDTLDRLPGDLRKMAQMEKSTVRLNIRAASACMTAAVIEYRQNHDIQFRLVQNPESERCDIDIFTRQKSGGASGGEEYIFTEPVMLAVPDADRFRRRTSIGLGAVREEEFVCLAGTKEFRSICDGFCAKEGFLPRVVFESDAPSTVQNLIASGCGVGFWPRYTWGSFASGAPVRLLELTTDGTEESYTRDIVIRLSEDADAAAREFFGFLVDYMERMGE